MSVTRDFKVTFEKRTFVLQNLNSEKFRTVKEVVILLLKSLYQSSKQSQSAAGENGNNKEEDNDNYSSKHRHKKSSSSSGSSGDDVFNINPRHLHSDSVNHYYFISAKTFTPVLPVIGDPTRHSPPAITEEERQISFNTPFITAPGEFYLYRNSDDVEKPKRKYTRKKDIPHLKGGAVHSSSPMAITATTAVTGSASPASKSSSKGTSLPSYHIPLPSALPPPVVKRKRGRPPKNRKPENTVLVQSVPLLTGVKHAVVMRESTGPGSTSIVEINPPPGSATTTSTTTTTIVTTPTLRDKKAEKKGKEKKKSGTAASSETSSTTTSTRRGRRGLRFPSDSDGSSEEGTEEDFEDDSSDNDDDEEESEKGVRRRRSRELRRVSLHRSTSKESEDAVKEENRRTQFYEQNRKEVDDNWFRKRITYFMNEFVDLEGSKGVGRMEYLSQGTAPPVLNQDGNRRDYLNDFYFSHYVTPKLEALKKMQKQDSTEKVFHTLVHDYTEFIKRAARLPEGVEESKTVPPSGSTSSFLFSSPESFLFNPFFTLYDPSLLQSPSPLFTGRKKSLVLPLVVGSCVEYVNREDAYHSHQWTVYVRGLFNGYYGGRSGEATEDYVSQCIEKVVFELDKSFVNPVRVVTSAPFEVTEKGWGEFAVRIQVHLKGTFRPPHSSTSSWDYMSNLFPEQILKFRTGFSRGTPHAAQEVFRRYASPSTIGVPPPTGSGGRVPPSQSPVSSPTGASSEATPTGLFPNAPELKPGPSVQGGSTSTNTAPVHMGDITHASSQNNQLLWNMGRYDDNVSELNTNGFGRQFLYKSPFLAPNLTSCRHRRRGQREHSSWCSSSSDVSEDEEAKDTPPRKKWKTESKSQEAVKAEPQEDERSLPLPPGDGGACVVNLSHTLRFSHRTKPTPCIPPTEEMKQRHSNSGNEKDGYLLVPEPVVTEQYEEIEIPLFMDEENSSFSPEGEGNRSRKVIIETLAKLERYLRLFLYEKQQVVMHLLHPPSSTMRGVGHPSPNSTAVREEKERITKAFNYSSLSSPPLRGGVSCFEKLYKYGDMESKDYYYSMSFLSSALAVAREEGWLVPHLSAQRHASFGAASFFFFQADPSTTKDGVQQQPHQGEEETGERKKQRSPSVKRETTSEPPKIKVPNYGSFQLSRGLATVYSSPEYRTLMGGRSQHFISLTEFDAIAFLLLFSSDTALFHYYPHYIVPLAEEMGKHAERLHIYWEAMFPSDKDKDRVWWPVHSSVIKQQRVDLLSSSSSSPSATTMMPNPLSNASSHLHPSFPPPTGGNNNNNNNNNPNSSASKFEDMSHKFYFLNGMALNNDNKSNASHFQDLVKLRALKKELVSEIAKVNKMITQKKVIQTLQKL